MSMPISVPGRVSVRLNAAGARRMGVEIWTRYDATFAVGDGRAYVEHFYAGDRHMGGCLSLGGLDPHDGLDHIYVLDALAKGKPMSAYTIALVARVRGVHKALAVLHGMGLVRQDGGLWRFEVAS